MTAEERIDAALKNFEAKTFQLKNMREAMREIKRYLIFTATMYHLR